MEDWASAMGSRRDMCRCGCPTRRMADCPTSPPEGTGAAKHVRESGVPVLASGRALRDTAVHAAGAPPAQRGAPREQFEREEDRAGELRGVQGALSRTGASRTVVHLTRPTAGARMRRTHGRHPGTGDPPRSAPKRVCVRATKRHEAL